MRFIIAVLAAIGLILFILLFAPSLVPTQNFKGLIEDAASENLGRKVTLSDDIEFKLIPTTAFQVRDLQIENAEGFDAPYLASIEQANIGVKLLPLLSRTVEIDNFVLVGPSINLERRANGAVNWDIAQSGEGDDVPASDGPGSGGPGSGGPESGGPESGGNVNDLKLGDVRLVDGRISYVDAAAQQSYLAEDVDLDIRLASFSQPLEANGSMIFQGAPAQVSLVITTLRDLLDGAAADLILDATLDDAKIGADLAVTNGDELSYSGPVSIDAPDLPGLAALFGASLADAPGFDNLSAKGAAEGGAEGLRLRDAQINFDAIDATGDLALDWRGAKPKATGALQVGALDLRPYMPPPTEAATGFPAWSEAALDFSSLRNIDAEFDLSAKKVYLNQIETGESRMTLVIQDGRLSADIPQMQLYEGGGSGRLVVNAKRNTPSFAGYFDFRSVQAEPFSKDVLRHDKLLGLGKMKVEFTAAGGSQAAIMRSLDGNGEFDLADGAIKGVNLVKLASAVQELYQGGLTNPAAITSAISAAQRPDETTDFSKFLSNFTVENGVATAPTINLTGPYLTMTGRGNVNIAGQTIDLRLNPRVTSTSDGVEGRAIAIPMRIGGTFSNPEIGIDVETLLRARAEGQGRKLLEDALGLNDQKEEGEEPSAGEEIGRAILKGLFDSGDED